MSGVPARRYLRRHARAAAKPHRGGAPGGDAEGPWCPLDAEDFAMAAVLALARATEPALREELERRCPASGAVKYVRSKGSGRAFRALVRTGFGYLAPTVGAACAGLGIRLKGGIRAHPPFLPMELYPLHMGVSSRTKDGPRNHS